MASREEQFDAIFNELKEKHIAERSAVEGNLALKSRHSVDDFKSVKKMKSNQRFISPDIKVEKKGKIIQINPTEVDRVPRRAGGRYEKIIIPSESTQTQEIKPTKVVSLSEAIKEKRKKEKEVDKKVKQILKSLKKIAKKEDRERAKNAKKAKKEEAKREEEYYKKRITRPKKRNIFARLHNIKKYNRGDFDYIEDEVLAYKDGELSLEAIEDDWKEIQRYEDTRDDAKLRKGWNTFKLSLAAIALTGAIALGAHTVNQAKQTFQDLKPKAEITTMVELDEEQQENLKAKALLFQSEVHQRDGYVFDYLTQFEIAEGYLKITNYEKNIFEKQFEGASNSLRDQEFLENIVKKAYGEEAYNNFTLGQKRDYIQMAFEGLFVTHPKYFNHENCPFRNPIVIDHLNARDAADAKGYHIKLKVNNDLKVTVKDLGSLLHEARSVTYRDFVDGTGDEGQTFLENLVKGVIGERYDELKKDDRRDYIQFAYEMLPSEIKSQYVKDPIMVEREANMQTNDAREIGD